MRDQTSAELTGWLTYLQVDDEAQSQRTAIAILKALGKVQRQPVKHIEEDEPVIDTTDPSFTAQFQGFINAPGQRN